MSCCDGDDVCPMCTRPTEAAYCGSCGDYVDCVCELYDGEECCDCANMVDCAECGGRFNGFELNCYDECDDCEQQRELAEEAEEK